MPYLRIDRLEARRDHNVRSIVGYAATHVPFYRDWFQEDHVRVDEIRTAGDLIRLPIVDKKTLQANEDRFVAETAEARGGLRMRTSGSTGAPLSITQSRRYILSNAAVTERDRAVLLEALGPGVQPRIASVAYPGGSAIAVQRRTREWAYVPRWVDRETLSLFDPIETIVAGINRRKPNVITAYGSFLELLFGVVKARRLEMHVPLVVIYVSDHLTPGGRRMLENDFGITVLSGYGAVEAFRIGFACLASEGFHLNSDRVHVRVVDSAGEDVPDGSSGEIVLSNLVNRGTVLLNYRIGDVGRLAVDAGCPCGRTLPRLAELEGRRDDVIELRGGRHVHSAEIWSLVQGSEELIPYQLVQHTIDRFELRIVATDQAMFERLSDDLAPRLRPLLGESVELVPAFIDASRPFGIEKRRQVISYVTRPERE